MEISRLFGLPAHPLLVHVAVVLFPAVALGLVAITLSDAMRSRYRFEVLGGAVVAFVMVLLTKGSGESLEESVKETTLLERHTELGNQLPLFALLVLLASIVVVGLDVYQRRIARRSVGAAAASPTWVAPLRIVSMIFAIVSALLAVWWTVRVGHSGARATWPK
jgi:divalent metal cation (Fe/Co/Zn/Cd) transporter